MDIPKNLWNNAILVENREIFIENLKNGIVLEFHFINDLTRSNLRFLIDSGWRVIKFGRNCIMP